MEKPNYTLKDKTLNGLGNLIRLLPTGTVFIYQFLNPILTNNGHCAIINKYLSGILIALCGLSCGFSCFTDSYTDNEGTTHYGIATMKGLWPTSKSMDTSSYKIGVGDFVHAFFTIVVFGVVTILDRNTVECFFPVFESTEKMLIMVLPPVVGAISSVVFMVFPNKRHGIGYPSN
ncbi:hypothetical protein KY285_001557 [Solanum tuberosum]|nr:hypothetical protein KY289_001833 [Solanum tuberosum]KAH0765686.1 hypothetical protein KY285_001557 [Solanum tuberosum]